VIDGIIKEPLGGAHRKHEEAAESVKKQLLESLKRLKKMKADKLISQRIDKYSKMGAWAQASKATK